MKHLHLIFGLTMVCSLLLPVACGSGESATKEPVIETAASEMNLSAADLGAGWSLQLEQSLDELPALKEEKAATDASLRTFVSAGGEVIASQTLTTKSATAAKNTMEAGMAEATINELKEQLPGLDFEEIEAPAVGDEAVLVWGDVSDLGLNVYVLSFRKSNVLALLFLLGPEEQFTEATVMDYAQKLEAKIR
jgi:hypothetical protein